MQQPLLRTPITSYTGSIIQDSTSRRSAANPDHPAETQPVPAEAKNNDSLESFRLMFYHEIPPWQQENEYILSGYRPTSSSVFKSIQSISYIHNETVSICSHLLGAALFIALPYIFADEIRNHGNAHAGSADFAVFSVYALGVAICFLLSSTCHIVWNCTPDWAHHGNQLDYLGIILLMWGASVPTIYYGFYDDAHLQRAYWTLMSIAALMCGVVTMSPRFSHPRFRPCRAAIYASLGVTAILFVAHGILVHGWETQNERMSLTWMLWMASFNLVGAVVYATRIPERWAPYKFDIWGASHQIFHVMVIVAGLIHFLGLLRALEATR